MAMPAQFPAKHLRPITQPIELPLELAFIRWSVVNQRWFSLSNDQAILSAFLAGWMCRTIGASEPQDVGLWRDSFRAGWREAEEQLTIAQRENTRSHADE